MNVRSLAFAALALMATSATLAEGPRQKTAALQPVSQEQTLIEELVLGMRGVLRTVTPEISLPALELKLPTVELGKR